MHFWQKFNLSSYIYYLKIILTILKCAIFFTTFVHLYIINYTFVVAQHMKVINIVFYLPKKKKEKKIILDLPT